jgi:phosphatidylglycerol:prolipoprotein diacylglycerol transferase
MLTYPHFNPIALQIGPLAVRWYGLMYVLGFVLILVVGRLRIRQRPGVLGVRDLDDLLFFGMLGVVLGGRLGYVLFYQPGKYFADPIDILKVWQGGMSFHGGLIGVAVAMLWFARSRRVNVWDVSDFICPLVPMGLAAGRMGNFINGELWGRPATVPWAMVFPQAGDAVPRHPSQLYELGLEGIVLFIVMWIYSSRSRPRGAVTGVFLVGYGCARFFVEFFRQPDDFLDLLALGLSMGQWLSLPMIGAGVLLWIISMRGGTEPAASGR